MNQLLVLKRQPETAGKRASLLRRPSRTSGFLRDMAMYPLSTEKKAVQSEGLSVALERHYSVPEVATLWALSERTIRRMFENEPGVLCWGSSERRFKRGYKITLVLRLPLG